MLYKNFNFKNLNIEFSRILFSEEIGSKYI